MKTHIKSKTSLPSTSSSEKSRMRPVPNRWTWFWASLLAILFCLKQNAWSQDAGGGQNATAAHFSVQPTSAEISRARIFDEPLISMGGEPSVEENIALADALTAYANRTNLDDFSSLTGFLDHFPDSKWSGSLLLHLGIEYYNSGYYSRAMDAWEQAWVRCKNIKDGPGKVQADRAVGELARMYSRVGRIQELDGLMQEIKGRDLSGPGTQLIAAAKTALSLMKTQPGFCFKCGPLALDRIRSYQNPSKAEDPLVVQAQSTTNGYSLSQLARLSLDLGMHYQMAFRSPGAPLVLPAVVHWKVGHYAALLQRDGDRVLAQDFTFHGRVWISMAALNDQASGYFLVPPGPLPDGWRAVAETEAQSVYGKGVTGGGDPGGTGSGDGTGGGGGGDGSSCGGAGPGPEGSMGMATYTFHLMLVDLTLMDTPVGYVPPVGSAIHFQATYNQLEANQPATFYYSNLGQKWTCNWIAFITDNPTSPNADVSFYEDGGGTLNFTGFNPTTQAYDIETMTQALLTKTSGSSYQMLFKDGSQKVFTTSDGSVGTVRRIFLTQIIDPAGNIVRLNYDSSLRITNIVDAIGQSTTLLYTNTVYTNAITTVIDPFGRVANFQYNSSGMLAQITDVLGLTSQFTYGSSEFISALTTPYGTTKFATGGSSQTWLSATDPLGQTEYLMFSQGEPINFSDPAAIVPHGMGLFNDWLYGRNSFYWDKKAYADGYPDYTKAKIYHWLHEPDVTTCSRELESVKEPLENRVWYNYPGQIQSTSVGYAIGPAGINRPSIIGRVMDDGSTQLFSYGYNSFGNMTNSIDPVGRTFSYIYATNNVDLLQKVMTHNGKHEVQTSITYNSQHLPLTITDAAGQTTTNTYNSRGQLLTTANPKGELTALNYNANGYLTNIVGHLQNSSDVTSFTYDNSGRVHTATDTEGYTLTFAYDAFDRKTSVTHPDGTFEQFVYTNLDLLASRDRLGRWTTNTFDANRHLIKTRDPLGRVTQYEWCRCGAMTGLTDPIGRTTTWDYDVQSRPTAKHYADGSTITYTYENTTSRLKNKIDEEGQETDYEYYPDNNQKRVSYPNAIVPTPTVIYTYDPDYNRILTMQDGIGTTTYAYNPITSTPALGAGQLASVSGPLPNSTVTYQYDQLGRAVSRAINGVAAATTFDVLDRPSVVTNALGSFRYSYVDATPRLASERYPNGQTNLYSYYNNLGDERLQQILHLYPNGSLLSSFGYAYNPVGQITYWTNQLDTTPARFLAAGYDAADQLTNAVLTDGVTTFNSYAYAYDPAGNRLQSQINGVTQQYSYNALNQLTATVPAQTNSATYEWDAEKRLTAINQGTNRSEFSYDGLGRRLRIVEKTNGVVQSENYYLWCGTKICEMRDASGATVLRRLFPQGESLIGANGSTNFFYTRDHLGSVREAVGANGLLATRYNYDPYGQKSVVQENVQTTFDFAGDFIHQKSGLYLTWFRPFDSITGRWLSRDPLGETTGVNLYSYVDNSPLRYIDPYGLCDNSNGNGDNSNPTPQVPPGVAAGTLGGVTLAAFQGLTELAGEAAKLLGDFAGTVGLGLGAYQTYNDEVNLGKDSAKIIAGNSNPYDPDQPTTTTTVSHTSYHVETHGGGVINAN